MVTSKFMDGVVTTSEKKKLLCLWNNSKRGSVGLWIMAVISLQNVTHRGRKCEDRARIHHKSQMELEA